MNPLTWIDRQIQRFWCWLGAHPPAAFAQTRASVHADGSFEVYSICGSCGREVVIHYDR